MSQKFAGRVRDQGRDRTSLAFASLLHDELVGDVRGVVLKVDCCDVFIARLNLRPTIDFDAHVLFHHIGMSVANADDGALAHNVELVVERHHLDAAVLVTDDALGHSVKSTSIIASSLADHLH